MWTKEHHLASYKGEKIFSNTPFHLLMFECGCGFEMMYIIFFLGPRFLELTKLLVLVPTRLHHSHKKRKDSLETRTERAVLRAYVKNQAILEPILLYRVSKYKQTK